MKRIVCIILFVCLFTACQPTPEQEYVHQKDETQMITDAQQPVADNRTVVEQVDAPQIWEKTVDDDNFHIRAHAAVYVPDCSALSIYETEAIVFTQEKVDTLWKKLVGDSEMRESRIDDTQLPKSQLALMMQNEKERIEGFEQNEYYEENVKNCEDRIKYYQSLYPNAPDDWAYTPVTSEIKEMIWRADEGVQHVFGIDATDGNGMTFRLYNDSYYEKNGSAPIPHAQFQFQRSTYMFYTEYRNNVTLVDPSAAASGADGLLLSPKEAIATADDLIRAVDSEMEVDRIELYPVGIYNDAGVRQGHTCYAIVYHRTANGCPIAIINGSTGGPAAATPAWAYEQCAVLVDDDGIQSVKWDAPLKIGECRVQSCKLLTFADAEPLAETMLRYMYSGQAEGIDLTINVTDVKLELMRTVQQDNITKGLVVPVWNFYGTRQRHFDSDQFDDDETMNMLLLSLNAVSGNPINASLGY